MTGSTAANLDSGLCLDDANILVIGADGFIGGALTPYLRQAFPRATVTGVSLGPGRDAAIINIQADLLDTVATRQVLARVRPDVVFHLAGIIHSQSWEELYRANVQVLANVLDAIQAETPRAEVLLSGSAAEYGRVAPSEMPLTEEHPSVPISHYGVSKAWQTTLARSYAAAGVRVRIGRMFNVIGPHASERLSIGAFVSQIRRALAGGESRMVVGNLEPRRDFIDLQDAVEGLTAVLRRGRPGEVYNLCSGHSVRMGDILDAMIAASGAHVEIVQRGDVRPSPEVDDIYGSCAKTSRDIGWTSRVSLTESIARLFPPP